MNRVDCTDFFCSFGPRYRTKERVTIEVAEHAYLPDMEMQYGWLPKSRHALQLFAAEAQDSGRRVNSFCSIGVGPGIEVIAAIELLDPKQVIVSDIHRDVVDAALRNVSENCHGFGNENLLGTTGSLCSGLIDGSMKCDLIYENLPNLPIRGGFRIDKGSSSASFFESNLIVPDEVSRNMLSLHYAFLGEASRCLESRGEVLCCVGLRIPLGAVKEMFSLQGFSFKIVLCDLVLQLHAGEVLAHYQEAEEKSGREFEFYRFDPAHEVVAEILSQAVCVEPEILREALQPFRINARKANLLHHIGERIGHLGIVAKGMFLD